MLFFGDDIGRVTVVDGNYRAIASFRAHAGPVGHIYFAGKSDVLITVGDGIDARNERARVESKRAMDLSAKPISAAEDAPSSPPSSSPPRLSSRVKLWRVSTERQTYEMISTIKIFGPNEPERPVTCFDATSDLRMMTAGLADGKVLLWRGGLLSVRPPTEVLRENDGDPVTKLTFVRSDDRRKSLFVVTSRTVCVKTVVTRQVARSEVALSDDAGAAPHCVAAIPQTGQIAVVSSKDNAVYFFTTELRGRCYAFDRVKTRMCWVRERFLLIESVAPIGAEDDPRRHPRQRHVDVYDLERRLSVFHFPLRCPSRLLFVLEAWGRVVLVTSTHEMIELRERSVDAKLEQLFRLNLFDVAKSMVVDPEEAHKKYADFLFQVGDCDRAVRHYVDAGKAVEPSYVIERFLSLPANLALYLEALHARRRQNGAPPPQAELTELLLGCYFKMDARDRIDRFVRGRVRMTTAAA